MDRREKLLEEWRARLGRLERQLDERPDSIFRGYWLVWRKVLRYLLARYSQKPEARSSRPQRPSAGSVLLARYSRKPGAPLPAGDAGPPPLPEQFSLPASPGLPPKSPTAIRSALHEIQAGVRDQPHGWRERLAARFLDSPWLARLAPLLWAAAWLGCAAGTIGAAAVCIYCSVVGLGCYSNDGSNPLLADAVYAFLLLLLLYLGCLALRSPFKDEAEELSVAEEAEEE